MTPQQTQALIGAVVALLTAVAGYFAHPHVKGAIERHKARKALEKRSEAPLSPPDAK